MVCFLRVLLLVVYMCVLVIGLIVILLSGLVVVFYFDFFVFMSML